MQNKWNNSVVEYLCLEILTVASDEKELNMKRDHMKDKKHLPCQPELSLLKTIQILHKDWKKRNPIHTWQSAKKREALHPIT